MTVKQAFVMKRRFKVLPSPLGVAIKHPDNEFMQKIWRSCVEEEKRIEPRFNRNGFYLDRQTKETWVELNGQAFLYLGYEGFKSDLEYSEGNNRLHDDAFQAIKILIDYKLADQRQRKLFQIEADRRCLRVQYISGQTNIRQFRKRLNAFRAKLAARQSGWKD